jgi:cyclohexyl-isocyanide hydratase
MNSTTHIGILAFPGVLQMDLTGPFGVFAAGPGAKVDLIWKDTRPIYSSDGLAITPTLAIKDCPNLDVLCVPGGGGVVPLLDDKEILAFLKKQSATLRILSSVCTGSLVLGAAGLLAGKRATTHWMSMDLLAEFGAITTKARVVQDGNVFSAAGVSSGIDMALSLAGVLWGDEAAEQIQLQMEYSPEPPYTSGSPESAPAMVLSRLKEKNAIRQEERRIAVLAAAAKL